METFYYKIKVCSVDVEFVNNIKLILSSAPKFLFAGQTSSLNSKNADLIIYDHSSADESLRSIPKTKKYDHKVLVLSENPADFFKVVDFGIDGFLANRENFKEILDYMEKTVTSKYPIDALALKLIIKNFKRNYYSELTEREKQVMDRMEQHKAYNDIALEMNITLNTLKSHVDNIFTKLNVSNKYQAINRIKDFV